jgi:hypothetical protein
MNKKKKKLATRSAKSFIAKPLQKLLPELYLIAYFNPFTQSKGHKGVKGTTQA